MNSFTFLIVVLLFCARAGRAQDDSTRYINGLPVTADDSIAATPPEDRPPFNRLIPVAGSKLPRQLLAVLEKESQYEGWRDTTIYLDQNTHLYIVPLRRSDGIRIFGLNKRGDPVTFREVADGRDGR
jgi:hypothetical protein